MVTPLYLRAAATPPCKKHIGLFAPQVFMPWLCVIPQSKKLCKNIHQNGDGA